MKEKPYSLRLWLSAFRRLLRSGVALTLASALASVALAAPGDLVIPRKGGTEGKTQISPAVFPHWVHRVRYRCDACHNRLFQMKLGATEITMDQMFDGESCATCHNGKRAFAVSFSTCNRCHAAGTK